MVCVLQGHIIKAQELEPIKLCTSEPVVANWSGVISYNPANSNNTQGYCNTTLTGLQNDDHLIFVVSKSAMPLNCTKEDSMPNFDGSGPDKNPCMTESWHSVSVNNGQASLSIPYDGENHMRILYYHGK